MESIFRALGSRFPRATPQNSQLFRLHLGGARPLVDTAPRHGDNKSSSPNQAIHHTDTPNGSRRLSAKAARGAFAYTAQPPGEEGNNPLKGPTATLNYASLARARSQLVKRQKSISSSARAPAALSRRSGALRGVKRDDYGFLAPGKTPAPRDFATRVRDSGRSGLSGSLRAIRFQEDSRDLGFSPTFLFARV